jgi:hypothetical protein
MNEEMTAAQELTDFILEPVEPAQENRPMARPDFGRQASQTQDHISTIMQGLLEPADFQLPVERPVESECEPTLFSHLNPEIEYPQHVLRANGISFVSSDGRLFATNRGKDNKHIYFGLTNFDRNIRPGAQLLVYLQVPGKHEKISSCAACVEKYNAHDFMELTFCGKRQTREVALQGGYHAIVCPIVDNISSEDNNKIYQIRFNCFTSHLKDNKTDRVKLVFAIVNEELTEQIWEHKVELEVTANPGRDSGCFVPASKRTAKMEPGVSVKRPKLADVKSEMNGESFEHLSVATKQMIMSKVAPEDCQQFMFNMDRRILSMLNTEIDLFCNQQNATG